MTNAERRHELAKARRKAVQYAEAAEKTDHTDDPAAFTRFRQLADTYALVAQALKVGVADGPDAIDGYDQHLPNHSTTR